MDNKIFTLGPDTCSTTLSPAWHPPANPGLTCLFCLLWVIFHCQMHARTQWNNISIICSAISGRLTQYCDNCCGAWIDATFSGGGLRSEAKWGMGSDEWHGVNAIGQTRGAIERQKRANEIGRMKSRRPLADQWRWLHRTSLWYDHECDTNSQQYYRLCNASYTWFDW
jgi:hypothetical protein